MKITDMNVDCLESCLELLSIEDLLNAADSNKRLNHAARYVFARVYGQKKVHLCLRPLKSDEKHVEFDSFERLYIFDLKMGLQFLRLFGDLVLEMYMSSQQLMNNEKKPKRLSEYEHLIIEYINEYCSESLTKIEFRYNTPGGLDKLTKPFIKVKELGMHNSSPTKQKLNVLFPKICKFHLKCDNIDIFLHNDSIVSHFSHLEHLTIYQNIEFYSVMKIVYQSPTTVCYDFQGPPTLCYEKLANLLRLNPQLKSLEGNIWIDTIYDENYHRETNKILPNIQDLRLSIQNKKHLNKTNSEIVHLKTVKELSIEFNQWWHLRDWLFPFRCVELESLSLSMRSIEATDFFNLIDEFPNLKKLELGTEGYEGNYSNLSQKLPLLEEFDIQGYSEFGFFATIDELVRFVNDIQSLKKLKITHSLFSEEDLLPYLGNVWSISSRRHQNNSGLFILKLNRKS